MTDLGTRAPKPKRERLGSSFRPTLTPIATDTPPGTSEVTTVSTDAETPAPASEPKTTVVEQPTPAAKDTRKSSKSSTGRSTQQKRVAAVEHSSAATVGVTIRLEEPLRKRLLAYRDEKGLSYPTVVMLAVQSSYPQMRELLSAQKTDLGISDDMPNLFGLPAAVSQHSNTAAAPKFSIPIKVSPERKAVLDRLVTEFEAQSLNELIVTALENWLPERVK